MAAAMGNQAFGALVASGGVIARDPGPGATAAPPAAAATLGRPGLRPRHADPPGALRLPPDRVRGPPARARRLRRDGDLRRGGALLGRVDGRRHAAAHRARGDAAHRVRGGVQGQQTRRSARSPRRSSRSSRSGSTPSRSRTRTCSSCADGPPPVRAERRHGRPLPTVELVGKAEELIGEVAKWGKRAETRQARHRAGEEARGHQQGDQGDLRQGRRGQEGPRAGAEHRQDDRRARQDARRRGRHRRDGGGARRRRLRRLQARGARLQAAVDGYIFKAAKICLKQLRALKEQLYKGDRAEGVRFFFEQSRARDGAVHQDAYFHGVDPSQHFPGASRCSTSCGR